MTYILPRALVSQVFTTQPAVLTRNLRAAIIGPHYQLVRYAQTSERQLGLLGEYNPTADTEYEWPNLASNAASVDLDFVKVFVEQGLLQYFHNSASTGDTMVATHCDSNAQDALHGDATGKNVIRAAATNWQTSGAYARASAFYGRDVALGDTVRVQAVVDSEVVEHWSTVHGFLHDKVVAAIVRTWKDADNVSNLVDELSESDTSSVEVADAADNAGWTLTATIPDESPSHVYETGVVEDVYTLRVTEGGVYGEAVFSLVSASGSDDEDDIVLAGSLGDPEEVGSKGLTLTFEPGSESESGEAIFTTGQAWTITVSFKTDDIDPVAGGDYTGTADTTYVVRVTRGGSFTDSANLPQISVTTSTGVDYSGPHTVPAAGTAVAIGAYGLTITFNAEGSNPGLALGDRFYITVTAEGEGAVRGLVLADDLPDELLGIENDVCGTAPDLSVTLYLTKNMQVSGPRTGYAPVRNWEAEQTGVTVNDGILLYTADWTDLDGVQLPLPLKGGTLYVEYRAFLNTHTTGVGSAATTSSLSETAAVEAALGPVTPDNPLAYGVYKALANAGGTPVLYVAVLDNTLEAYLDALAILGKRGDAYALCVLTHDRGVQDALAAHINSYSTPEQGRWRIGFTCLPIQTTSALLAEDADGNAILGTITDDPSTSATDYRLVTITSADVNLIELGVRAGDSVRAAYTSDGFGNVEYASYLVAAVLSSTTLRLRTGPAEATPVASKLEIWRNNTKDEQAADLVLRQGSFANRRIFNIWPDTIGTGGVDVPGYFLGAAVAGAVSGIPPQQGLTNLQIIGFDDASRTTEYFTDAQLDTIAGGGGFIVTQSELGMIYCRHELSTDPTDLNTRELMRAKVVDSASYTFLSLLAPYVGQANISPYMLAQMRTVVLSGIDFLSQQIPSAELGPIMISAEIAELRQHPTLRDRIIVRLSPTEFPFPLNNPDLTLVI